MNSFHTRSSARKSILTIICTFIPLFLLALLGLRIGLAAWLFFEGILLVTFVFCLFLVARTHWEIRFQGRDLSLYNTGNHQSYHIDSLTRSDLIIKQTEKQKQKDTCDLKIMDTHFGIYDVQGCGKLRQYIEANIPE